MLGEATNLSGNAVPGGESDAATRDADGRLTMLNQSGWLIHYVRDDADPLRRPRRLDIAQGTQQIRMVIDEWRDSR